MIEWYFIVMLWVGGFGVSGWTSMQMGPFPSQEVCEDQAAWMRAQGPDKATVRTARCWSTARRTP